MNNSLPMKKSKDDNRDIIWDKIYASTIPSECSHIDDLLSVRHQGKQGTCFAQSAACMKEWQEKKDYGLSEYLSPQFFYNQRDYWNNGKQDGDNELEDYGMSGRDVMQILQKIGICTEREYPYGKIQKSNEIPAEIYESAKKNCIKSYARIDNLDGLKSSLYQNGPCLIAFPVYNYTTEMWKPKDNEKQMGGHAMVVVGYSDKEQHFIIRNSWGTSWGVNGYCYYKYEDWGAHWECWTTIDEKTIIEEPPTKEQTTQTEKLTEDKETQTNINKNIIINKKSNKKKSNKKKQ